MMMFMCIFRKVYIDSKIFPCIRPFEDKHNAFFKMTSITINSDVAGRIESITQRHQSTLMTKPFIYCLASTSNLLKCTVDFRDLFSTFNIFFHKYTQSRYTQILPIQDFSVGLYKSHFVRDNAHRWKGNSHPIMQNSKLVYSSKNNVMWLGVVVLIKQLNALYFINLQGNKSEL